jgi:hypothetical protein
MAILFNELLDELRKWDEVSLMELLGLTADDIIDRFEDVIEQRQEEIRDYFEEESDETLDG